MTNTTHKFKRIMVILLSLAIILSSFPWTSYGASEESDEAAGYIVLSIEKHDIGLGWIQEPVKVYYKSGEKLGELIYKVLGEDRIAGTVSSGNISYLSGIKDDDTREINPPEIYKSVYENNTGRQKAGWLQAFDYTKNSGWMYTSDNVVVNAGMGSVLAQNGMVVRLYFVGDYTKARPNQNMTSILGKIAQINSSENKSELLADSKVKSAYDKAVSVASNLDASQSDIDEAYKELASVLSTGTKYTLTYDVNGGGGSVKDENTYEKGDFATVLSGDDLYCYEEKDFVSWNTKADGSGISYSPGEKLEMKDGNVTLYAIWAKEHTVTYDANVAGGGGTTTAPTDSSPHYVGDTVSIKVLSSYYTKPEAGLALKEWNTKADGSGVSYPTSGTFTMPDENLTLYAIWEKGYQVTYDLNGVSGSAITDTSIYLEGAQFSVKNCSLTDKTSDPKRKFASWNTKADGSGESYIYGEKIEMPKDGITLYAQYAPAYSVTYDKNGGSGSVSDSSLYLSGASASIYSGSSLTKGELVFSSWNTKADGSGESYVSSNKIVFDDEDIVLYAQYAQGHKITYNINGGKGTTPTDTKYYAEGTYVYPKSGTSLTGSDTSMIFDHWNTEADDSGMTYTTSSFVMGDSDITLYAIYKQGYSLTYDANGGTGTVPTDSKYYLPSKSVYLTTYGVSLTGPDGKAFLGWSLSKDGSTGTITTVAISEGENIVYAIYTDTLSVKYDLNGGSGVTPTDSKTYGGYSNKNCYTAKSDGIVAPEGKIMTSWNTKADGSGDSYGLYKSFTVASYIEEGISELTLYAQYETAYQVIYDTKGGSEISPSTSVATGSSVTLTSETPTKEGTTFVRWNTKADGTGKDYKPGSKVTLGEENLTLYARWSKNKVAYDAGVGTGIVPTDDNLYEVYAEVKTKSGDELKAPEGKHFVGWSLEKNDSSKVIAAGDTFNMAKADVTLYAVYENDYAPYDVYKTTGEYLLDALENKASYGSEWSLLGLARSGIITEDMALSYYESVKDEVKEKGSAALSSTKSTENARVILALTSMGKDVTNVSGYNLLEPLANLDFLKKQGINGPIWALIAFDSHDYEIPTVSDGTQVTRENLVETILAGQLLDGGWSFSGTTSDVDMTAMAIQALAPYYTENPKVKAAVDRALDTLSAMQSSDGSFSSMEARNPESCAQVITALTALGINPDTDSRFVKGGNSVVDALTIFYVSGGGFAREVGGKVNGMSTEQGYYALAAYYRLLDEKTSLYNMNDVSIEKATIPDKEDSSNQNAGTDKNTGNAGTDGTGNIVTRTGEESTSNNNSEGNPTTGDENMLPLWIILALAGSLGTVKVLRKED